MYSLNLPAPGAVSRLAADLAPALHALDRVRERHSIVVKRLGDDDSADRLESEVRQALRGAPAFEARITGIDAFHEPTAGPGPVVYLAVESPGLRGIHDRLVEAFGAIEGLEGAEYVPHVTLGRGGSPGAVDRLTSRDVDPITWTATELELVDARGRERVSGISLPA